MENATDKSEGGAFMKNFKGTKGVIILVILVVLVITYYHYLSNRQQPDSVQEGELAVMTPVQEVLTRNLETNYPATPREVVRYFSEITQCFYNEEYTEEELHDLALKIREIYDDELVANQTEADYLQSLNDDIAEFKAANRTIANFTLSSTIDVETYQSDGYEWAKLYCIYSVKEQILVNSNIQFLLRKDENGHYKIYGWQMVKNAPNAQETQGTQGTQETQETPEEQSEIQ